MGHLIQLARPSPSQNQQYFCKARLMKVYTWRLVRFGFPIVGYKFEKNAENDFILDFFIK